MLHWYSVCLHVKYSSVCVQHLIKALKKYNAKKKKVERKTCGKVPLPEEDSIVTPDVASTQAVKLLSDLT